jgi:hypothetical protein
MLGAMLTITVGKLLDIEGACALVLSLRLWDHNKDHDAESLLTFPHSIER